jgi:hypothetical protein
MIWLADDWSCQLHEMVKLCTSHVKSAASLL